MSAASKFTAPKPGEKWTSQSWNESFKNVTSPVGILVREAGKKALSQQEEIQAAQDKIAEQQADINRMQAQSAGKSYSTLRSRRGRAGGMSLLSDQSTLG